jgi:putative heme-binding domain-containing protein
MWRGVVGVVAALSILASTRAAPIDEALASGDIRAGQRAIANLAAQAGPEPDRALLTLFDRYLAGTLPAGLWLDLFEAAAQRHQPELKARLAAHEKKLADSRDPLARYRECLEGGNAQAGREIFTKSPVANCVRCHRIENEGAEIGPNLTVMRQVTDRIFILESIVDPSTTITAGFSHVLLTLKDGQSVSGLVAGENNDEITLTSIVDGKKRAVPQTEIAERTALPSAMPPGFAQILGKRALRDVVEFLASPE